MILAFSGPSSSGKTTILKIVRKNSFFSGKKIETKKEDKFITILILKKILGNKPFSEYKRTKFYEKRQSTILKFFSFFVNIFYPLLVYIEFLTEYFYYEVLFKKKIIIRDRYTYDYLITFKEILGISNSLIKVLYKNFPKPSMLFYISVNKKILIERNKNNVLNKITSKESLNDRVLNAYNKIAKEKNILTIDNNGPLRKSVEDIMFHIIAKGKISKLKTISFSGLDGSGKSTLIRNTSHYLDQLNIDHKTVHFYHDNIVFKLLKSFGFFQESNYKMTENAKKVPTEKSTFWGVLTWLDSYIQYLFAVFYSGRKKVILFDRYFYDYIVVFKYFRIIRIDLFKKIIPPVGFSFLVYCKPEIAFKRKPENRLEFFLKGSEEFIKLSKEFSMKSIDTSRKSRNRVFEEAINLITKD